MVLWRASLAPLLGHASLASLSIHGVGNALFSTLVWCSHNIRLSLSHQHFGLSVCVERTSSKLDSLCKFIRYGICVRTDSYTLNSLA
jgi:hypothetical protein